MKKYIDVAYKCDEDGIIVPEAVLWEDGRIISIDKVLHTCVVNNTESEGIRYSVKIGRAIKNIYFNNEKWYVNTAMDGG